MRDEKTDEVLRKYRFHLEELLLEGTNELRVSNEQLQKDITERKRAEVALRKDRSQLLEQLSFASALNRIAETIINKDDTYNILQTMTEIIGSTMCVDRAFI
ncbi:hypothetical protein JCM17380_45610 [Desulfosporosinus burensis]